MWIIASIIITHMWHLYMQKLSHDEWRRFYGWILLDFYLQKTNALHFLIDFFFYFFLYIFFECQLSMSCWVWEENKIHDFKEASKRDEDEERSGNNECNSTISANYCALSPECRVHKKHNTSNTLDLAFRNPST